MVTIGAGSRELLGKYPDWTDGRLAPTPGESRKLVEGARACWPLQFLAVGGTFHRLLRSESRSTAQRRRYRPTCASPPGRAPLQKYRCWGFPALPSNTGAPARPLRWSLRCAVSRLPLFGKQNAMCWGPWLPWAVTSEWEHSLSSPTHAILQAPSRSPPHPAPVEPQGCSIPPHPAPQLSW